MYRVLLPLVENTDYMLYQFQCWPVPFNSTGFSAQIEVQPVMGLDTVSGDIFRPSRCYGQKPQVCHAGVKTHQRHMKCERALITGVPHKQAFVVELRKENKLSKLTEISPGENILVTWGETIQKRCPGSEPIRLKLSAGVYAMKLSDDCMYAGEDWKVTPLRELKGRLSIMALKVKISNINLIQTVNNTKTLQKLKSFGKDLLDPVVRVTLQPLSEEYDADIMGNSYSTYELLTVNNSIILLGFLITIVVLVVLRFRNIQARGLRGNTALKEAGSNQERVNLQSDVERHAVNEGTSDEEAKIEMIQHQPPVFRFSKLYPKLEEVGIEPLDNES